MAAIDFLTTGQAAALTGYDRKTIYRWCASGRMQARKCSFSGTYRIPRSELVRIRVLKRDGADPEHLSKAEARRVSKLVTERLGSANKFQGRCLPTLDSLQDNVREEAKGVTLDQIACQIATASLSMAGISDRHATAEILYSILRSAAAAANKANVRLQTLI